ncbi:hypothetical protein NQ317_004308 [Molorchus minor]|uniref:GH84 domain-containing protein n=1 Tax=Molorchus minor TaxID=1323400 RepID=A0ABQ9JX14_9CUCU|nr:hypothetical protein NQ317_004308 [Molorchus minor]
MDYRTEKRFVSKNEEMGHGFICHAPKDDYKHRAYWRELYTVEEAEHLTGLIQAAKDQNITFYYALSPGLDITYSSAKEVGALKRKLEQVSQFGCNAFALLFDDIEPEMSEADKEVFQSFAQAQVSVTNECYQHLSQPKFLLCPTQYCSTRAVPNVTNSEYLNTLGSKLAQEIDIMWTGTKVITRTLTKENLQEIADVLRRPPVIWDNLHANDYDQKRVFLGPYSGRSPDLIPKLRGVLTNPNCEYGANFVAIHTLAQWSRCNVDAQRDPSINDTVSADIKLETETEDGLSGEDVPATLSANMYHPRQALRNAITEWLPEFEKPKVAWGPIVKPQPAVSCIPPVPIVSVPIIPSINTCMSITSTTSTSSTGSSATTIVNSNQLQALAEVCSTVSCSDTLANPVPAPVMNSLVSDTKVVCNESIRNPITPVAIPVPIDSANNKTITLLNGALIKPDKAKLENGNQQTGGAGVKENKDETSMNTDTSLSNEESSLSPSEPMDCNSTPNISPAHGVKCSTESNDDVAMSENSISSGSMQVDSSQMGTDSSVESDRYKKEKNLTLLLKIWPYCVICFICLSNMGGQSLQLLQEFNWLKSNAHVVITANRTNDKSGPEGAIYYCLQVQEWFARAEKMNEMTQAVNRLFQNISGCQNRELLYDLYSYIWDIRGVISLLNSYIKWLYKIWRSVSTINAIVHPGDVYMYASSKDFRFSKGWKETFMSGEQEPWVFRGGLTADLQRLIPVDSGNDLFVYKVPEVPTTCVYTIRPYLPTDIEAVYNVCTRTCKDGLEDPIQYPENLKDLQADKIVGPYVTLHPEFCFVVEDDSGVVGYACASPRL